MYYDIESNSVYILYKEKKSKKNTSHRFEGTPIFLQLDPLKPSNIHSVYFNVAPPDWMKDYASMNRFDFQEEYLDGEGDGFSIVSVEQYTSDAFTIEGKIQDWFNLASTGYTDIKNDLLANSQIVENNLLYFPELFEPYGLKVRTSEFDPNFYSINFREIAPNRNIDLSKIPENSEYRDEIIELSEKWHKLKDDLVTVREYPNEPINAPQLSDEELIKESSIEIETPTVVAPSIEIETPTVVAPSIEIETPAVVAPSIEIEAPTVVAPSIEIETPAVVAPSIEIETPAVVAPSIEIETPAVVASSIEIEAPTVVAPSIETEKSSIAEENTEHFEHFIVKQSSKKSGLISGQVLLF